MNITRVYNWENSEDKALTAVFFLSSKFIQDKYDGYSQKEAAYIAGAVYDSSLVLSAIVGILIVSVLFPSCLKVTWKFLWISVEVGELE